MGVLDQITEMRKQAIPENEIITKLQEQGISPNAIENALNQEQIKKAVSKDDTMGMENSTMRAPSPNQQKLYSPKTQEISETPKEQNYAPQENFYSPQENIPQETIPQEEYYPQQGYDETYQDTGNSNTMIDIAEQIFSERIEKIQNQVEDINEFKAITQAKIEIFSSRLKKIETIIDKLQIAILNKVGSYGYYLQSIKKEMSMMQDSFAKVVVPLTQKKVVKRKISKKK